MRELDYVRQGWEVAQFEIFIAWDVVGCANGGEHLRLLHGVDAEIGFEIEIQIEHVFGIAGFSGYDIENLFLGSPHLRGRRSCGLDRYGCGRDGRRKWFRLR